MTHNKETAKTKTRERINKEDNDQTKKRNAGANADDHKMKGAGHA